MNIIIVQQHQEDESDILSIFPESKKKRLKKTLDSKFIYLNFIYILLYLIGIMLILILYIHIYINIYFY